MPSSPAAPCPYPGCLNLLPCPIHRKAMSDWWRGSRQERGYDAQWERFRSWFLAQHPLCQDCEAAGRTTVADQVHHMRPIAVAPQLRLVEANCVPLCAACHGARGALAGRPGPGRGGS